MTCQDENRICTSTPCALPHWIFFCPLRQLQLYFCFVFPSDSRDTAWRVITAGPRRNLLLFGCWFGWTRSGKINEEAAACRSAAMLRDEARRQRYEGASHCVSWTLAAAAVDLQQRRLRENLMERVREGGKSICMYFLLSDVWLMILCLLIRFLPFGSALCNKKPSPRRSYSDTSTSYLDLRAPTFVFINPWTPALRVFVSFAAGLMKRFFDPYHREHLFPQERASKSSRCTGGAAASCRGWKEKTGSEMWFIHRSLSVPWQGLRCVKKKRKKKKNLSAWRGELGWRAHLLQTGKTGAMRRSHVAFGFSRKLFSHAKLPRA